MAHQAALEEAVAEEARVAAEVSEKELEVQQDKHQTLRTGSVGAGGHAAATEPVKEGAICGWSVANLPSPLQLRGFIRGFHAPFQGNGPANGTNAAACKRLSTCCCKVSFGADCEGSGTLLGSGIEQARKVLVVYQHQCMV